MFFLIHILKHLQKNYDLKFFFFSIQILKTSFSLLKNRLGGGRGGGGRASLPATGRRRDRRGEIDGRPGGRGTKTAMGVGCCSMGVKRLPEVGDDGGDR